MNRNHLWKLLLIVFLLVWAIYEMTPPSARPLVDYFKSRAVNQDATFNEIYERAKAADAEHPQRSFGNLQEAIGTNSIAKYFPFYDTKNEARPTTYILNRLQREAAGKVKLGIDLAGGTSFLVEMDTNRLNSVEITTRTNAQGDVITVTNVVPTDISGALNQAVEVFRKRVDALGVAEPVIQPEGNNRILIQLPGLSEEVIEDARKRIQKVAFLEFRLVHPQSRQLIESGSMSAPGYELLSEVRTAPDGSKQIQRYLVKRRPELVGGIKRAGLSRDNFGRPEILFTLEPDAAEKFAQITRENIGRQLAIVLDGELQSAPSIKGEIPGGSGSITGDYTEQQARALISVLENPLKAPVHIIDERKVDPTLGNDSIASGIRASLYGIIAVSAFMLIYYLLSGLIANVALCLNIIILMGVMCSIGATLTMPGIAGIALTIGMAVDANVLIFERIREELAAGKSLRGALNAGYNKAFGTIFDSNLTTLISSVILIYMGTGPVKGFGVTLSIGVAISMFTALVVTRLIFDFLLAKNLIKNLKMLHVIRSTKIDFMRWAIPAFIASWLLILIGNGYGLFVRGSDVLSVEFAGGETVTLGFDQKNKVEVDKLRETIREVTSGDVLVAYQRNISTGLDTLRVTARAFGTADEGVGEKIFQHLRQKFPEAKFGGEAGKPLSIERVGPTVGKEIQKTAVIASFLALFGILIYVAFRYEISFAVGAVVAIFHDILMTLGCYFLAGHELNATTVAALLTIIGFSINDTIVIFDRVREDLRLGVRGTFKDVMNRAINQTLSRTIITSGTVLLSTLSLYIFGGGVINDFAFTFLVGIISGTFSTIYIACFIVLRWHKGERPNIGSATPAPVDAAVPVTGK